METGGASSVLAATPRLPLLACNSHRMAAFAAACGAFAGPRPSSTNTSGSNGLEHARVSRRTLACAAAAALARLRAGLADDAAVAADVPPGLPAGAAEFSRVLAARERWAELGGAVAAARERETEPELAPAEWDSARAYLRAFYSIGNDMRALAKPWEPPLRKRADALAASLQRSVKAMDKPAREQDPTEFLALHKDAAGALAEFFDVFTDAAAGDMPAEL